MIFTVLLIPREYVIQGACKNLHDVSVGKVFIDPFDCPTLLFYFLSIIYYLLFRSSLGKNNNAIEK